MEHSHKQAHQSSSKALLRLFLDSIITCDRQEGNRVRGTVRTGIIISTVVTYLVRSSFISRLIYASRRRVVQVAIKGGITATPDARSCGKHRSMTSLTGPAASAT